MTKLLLVAAPLVLYATALAGRVALGRRPTRRAVNVEVALLLVAYFFGTAGLGVFWVANQQLPPFDLHYLLGYASLVLVVLHVALNVRAVVTHFKHTATASEPLGRRWLTGATAGLLFGAGTFFLGVRAGSPRLPASYGEGSSASLAAVEQTHAMSSHSRAGVVLRAPSVAWEEAVPAYHAWTGKPRVALPSPRPGDQRPRSLARALALERAAEGEATLEGLSLLLHATAGITERRGGLELRASASSGALFPTEVYVIVRAISGLPPGVYAYAPREHALIDLDRPPSDGAWGAPAQAGHAAAASLVLTSVLRRTGQKYRDRAYRYAVADAGHALGNALVAAAALGLRAAALPRFDDGALARAIGVDGELEVVVSALELHADDGAAPRSVAEAVFAPVTLRDPATLELGATALAHDATSLVLLAGSAPRGDPPSRPDEPTGNVFELIQTRRSVRSFEAGAIAKSELASVLDWAIAPEPVLSRAVRAHVVVSRVDGDSPGVLSYEPSRRALTRLRDGEFGADAGRAALDQEVVSGAHATVVLTLDRRILSAEGARGYRHAFLEAGVIGARLYLAASAVGLGGCSVGAFYDDEVSSLLQVDASAEWPIHLFALGRPQR